MGFGSFLKNVVTFGANSRIERKVVEYEEMVAAFNQLIQQVETGRKAMGGTLERVIDTKSQALLSLKSITRISSNLSPRDRNLAETFGGAQLSLSFDQINQTITSGEIATNSAKGVGAGVSTALGAWAIVGSFGTASTGTAISAVYGTAATNATLAFFGGGSLATGGYIHGDALHIFTFNRS